LIEGTYAYSADDVSGSTTSVEVNAVTTDANATVDVTGDTGLSAGENTVSIEITAEDGIATSTYTVTFIKHGVTIASPDAGAIVSAETFTVSGSYYGTAAPDSMTLTFGCQTNVTVTVEDPVDGVGTWTTDITVAQIAASDYTTGIKPLYAEATWGASGSTDIAGGFSTVDYQYASAAAGYSISGTVSTTESIPTGYYLSVCVWEAGAGENDDPIAMTITQIDDSTLPFDYTIEGIPAGDYELYAFVVESESSEDVLYYADGGDVTIGSSNLTGQDLVLIIPEE